jgi:hypothetical protein
MLYPRLNFVHPIIRRNMHAVVGPEYEKQCVKVVDTRVAELESIREVMELHSADFLAKTSKRQQSPHIPAPVV